MIYFVVQSVFFLSYVNGILWNSIIYIYIYFHVYSFFFPRYNFLYNSFIPFSLRSLLSIALHVARFSEYR